MLLASLLAASRLVVFQQAGSIAARDFEKATLPRLVEIAKRRGVEVELRDASAGAPAEVHLTPLIVYQDAEGRSIFQGRYSDLDRIAQFLRTVSAGPLAGAPTPRDEVAVWRRGRLSVVAPIKITSLTGVLPPRFDERAFAARARKGILAGLTRFRAERHVESGPSDRAFYMDFHPYRDAAGRLFVSTAVYSGFDCVTPVFSGFDDPTSGPYATLEEVFARASKRLEDVVAQLSVSSPVGDAFDPVSERVPPLSWERLGLALPAASPAASAAPRKAITLPARWVVAPASADDAPRLQFRFAPPLDNYAGEVRGIAGTIELPSPGRLSGATGSLEAETASVTMGNKTLDTELRNGILKTSAFPAARFAIDPVNAPDAPLTLGVPVPFTATGAFTLLGTTVPLSVRAQVEPVLAEDGSPRLDVRATFRLRLLEPFGLHGPEGPAPSNDTLVFDARFLLSPSASR